MDLQQWITCNREVTERGKNQLFKPWAGSKSQYLSLELPIAPGEEPSARTSGHGGKPPSGSWCFFHSHSCWIQWGTFLHSNDSLTSLSAPICLPCPWGHTLAGPSGLSIWVLHQWIVTSQSDLLLSLQPFLKGRHGAPICSLDDQCHPVLWLASYLEEQQVLETPKYMNLGSVCFHYALGSARVHVLWCSTATSRCQWAAQIQEEIWDSWFSHFIFFEIIGKMEIFRKKSLCWNTYLHL